MSRSAYELMEHKRRRAKHEGQWELTPKRGGNIMIGLGIVFVAIGIVLALADNEWYLLFWGVGTLVVGTLMRASQRKPLKSPGLQAVANRELLMAFASEWAEGDRLSDEYGARLSVLRDLLEERGQSFDLFRLDLLIDEAVDRLFVESLRGRISIIQAELFCDIWEAFIHATGDDYMANMQDFVVLLGEQNLSMTSAEIHERVRGAHRKVQLKVMENQLASTARKPLRNATLAAGDGLGFEKHLAEMFRRHGFEVSETPSTGDQGADLIVSKLGQNFAVQAKYYSNPVGNSAVQQAISALAFYNTRHAMVVTNSTFTRSARDLATKTGVRLVDGEELQKWESGSFPLKLM